MRTHNCALKAGFAKCAFFLSGLLLVVAISPGASRAADEIRFECDAMGDGNYELTISPDDLFTATAVYKLGMEHNPSGSSDDAELLSARRTDSGFLYIGKDLQFAGLGEKASLRSAGADMTVECHRSKRSGNKPQQAANQSPKSAVVGARGYTLGGKLRAGPGLNYEQVGSIRAKTLVDIVVNSGVQMDGYDWFDVVAADGTRGYQWGGLICSDPEEIKGLTGRCN